MITFSKANSRALCLNESPAFVESCTAIRFQDDPRCHGSELRTGPGRVQRRSWPPNPDCRRGVLDTEHADKRRRRWGIAISKAPRPYGVGDSLPPGNSSID